MLQLDILNFYVYKKKYFSAGLIFPGYFVFAATLKWMRRFCTRVEVSFFAEVREKTRY